MTLQPNINYYKQDTMEAKQQQNTLTDLIDLTVWCLVFFYSILCRLYYTKWKDSITWSMLNVAITRCSLQTYHKSVLLMAGVMEGLILSNSVLWASLSKHVYMVPKVNIFLHLSRYNAILQNSIHAIMSARLGILYNKIS